MASSNSPSCDPCKACKGLHSAARLGHDMCLDVLLRKTNDVNAWSDERGYRAREKMDATPLTEASDYGNIECVKILIAAGADVDDNAYRGSALEKAAIKCHYKCLEILITAGANVNLKNKEGNTALSMALRYHSSDKCIDLLIEAGADVNDQNKDGKTALMTSGCI